MQARLDLSAAIFLTMAATLALTAAPAAGTPLRAAAPTLIEAAPDLDTLPALFMPAAPDGEDDDDRAEANAKRDAAIAQLEKLIEAQPTRRTISRDRYELARLHLSRATALHDEAVRAYVTALDRWRIGELVEQPDIDLDTTKDELRAALDVFRATLANDPNGSRRDELNFLIADTLARVGNDHCEAYFTQAIRHSRSSEWLLKAELARGDYLVAKGKPDEALALYESVRGKAPRALSAYAAYRAGWVHLAKGWTASGAQRQDELQKAQAALEQVVTASDAADDFEDAAFHLREEAAHDLAWLWAVTDQEAHGSTFLAEHDLTGFVDVFREKLAIEALRKGDLEKGVPILRSLIAADREHPRAIDYRQRLCVAFAVAGNAPALSQETAAMVRMTSDDWDPWFDEHEGDEALMPRAKRMLELLPVSEGLAMSRAAEAIKDTAQKKRLLEGAIAGLGERLRQSPPADQIPLLRYTVAASLLALQRYDEALTQLDELAKLGARIKDLLPGVLEERLNILVKLDSEQKYGELPPPGEVPAPLPLPNVKKRLASAAQELLLVEPDAGNAAALRYKLTYDLFLYGHYDETVQRFEAFVHDYPEHELSRSAIDIALSLQLKRGNWPELQRLSSAFLANPKVSAPDVRKYIKQNLDYAKEQAAVAH
jgi:tetratricopeptide (TPR) repeat protein